MSDELIDAIRQVDPCPSELPAPPIEVVLRRLREEPRGAEPRVARRRLRIGDLTLVASSVIAVAVAVLALVLLGHAGRARPPAGGQGNLAAVPACRPVVTDGVLPAWARAGFSEPRPRMPYALGVSGRIAALLWVKLVAPPSTHYRNKILWVSRTQPVSVTDLRIRAQRMVGSTPIGAPVNRSVTGGPGPSIIDLPAAGCWRFTLRWSGRTDSIDLSYARSSA